MKKTLLLIFAMGLCGSAVMAQETTVQETKSQLVKPVQSARSSATSSQAIAKASGANLAAPMQRSTKLAPVQQPVVATSHAPGQGDANLKRAKLAKFMVGDALPEGFPEWDLATADKDQYKAIVAAWANANKNAVKPEYRNHPFLSSDSK